MKENDFIEGWTFPENSACIELYNVPNNTVCSFDKDSEPFLFVKPDGMYSYCLTQNNEVMHLAMWAPVYPWIKKKGKDAKTV